MKKVKVLFSVYLSILDVGVNRVTLRGRGENTIQSRGHVDIGLMMLLKEMCIVGMGGLLGGKRQIVLDMSRGHGGRRGSLGGGGGGFSNERGRRGTVAGRGSFVLLIREAGVVVVVVVVFGELVP